MQNNFYVSSFGTRYHSIGQGYPQRPASYWTPSLMSQFNLAGGVGGCSTSLHYGRMVTFGFCSKSPFISWEKEYGNMGCQLFKEGIQHQIDFWPKINTQFYESQISISLIQGVTKCSFLSNIKSYIGIFGSTYFDIMNSKLISEKIIKK